MKKIYKALIIAMLPMSLMAEFKAPPGYNNSGSNKSNRISTKYPADSSPEISRMPPKLQQNHFEINIDQDEVETIQKRAIRFKKLIDGTYDVNIMQDIDYRPFRAIDNIFLLTNYQTTIVFPANYRIQKSTASVELQENTISQNILILKPKKDFTEGNVIVSLTDGKKNTVVELILRKFIPKASDFKNIIHTFIKYVEVPKISDYRMLKIYFKMYGNKRISYFNRDGKFDIIEYKKIPFYIIRDDRFGRIEYKGVNFRIANRR